MFCEIYFLVLFVLPSFPASETIWTSDTPVINLPTPEVVVGSIGASSVELEWRGRGMNYTLEWKLNGDDIWCPAHTKPLPSSSAELVRVLVLNLKPYSGYIFKLSSSGQDSAFSADILTLAEGRPGSPPLLLSVRQLPQDRAVVEFTQPQIPNAKIISYSLTYSAVNFTSVEKGKDIIPLEGTEHQSYIIEGLTCNTTYRIEIKAKSLFGTSEPGFTLFEYICPERIDAKSIPWALVAMNQSVYKKDLRPSKQFEAVILLSQFDEFIKCLDVHQEYRFMFIVTESGKLFRESIFKDYEETRDQFVLNTGEDPVEYITVDWLYDKLYILKRIETGISAFSQDWIIDICELDGLKCKRMQHFFTRKPQHLQVDPFHGYLYWVDKDEYDSLLRVNLTHTGCSVYPQLMLKSLSLGPFVVSFTDYSVYIPVLDRNMMFQVSLKPPFKVTVLNETRTGTRGFDDVDAIVRYNNIFYWTSSQGFNVEFYDVDDDRHYYYNTMDTDIKSTAMRLLDISSQPFPVPINSVENLEVIFDSSKAMIKWSDPMTGFEEGCASYKAWRYRIQIHDGTNKVIASYDNVTDLNFSQDGDLSSDMFYSVRVQAFSKGGGGPWSNPFSGKTLNTNKTPSIFWADQKNIHTTDLFGYQGNSFSHNLSRIENILYVDISSSLLWSSSDFIFTNFNKKKWIPEKLRNEDSLIGSMVFEALGSRLYYSVPFHQQIRRINLEGEVELSVSLTSPAKNLLVDSSIAVLCWISSLNGLECSRLDGENKTVFHQVGIWDDQKILSAAIDPQNHDVYFILYNPKQFPKYEYHRKNILTNYHEKLGSLTLQHLESSLYYTSGKLIFLEGQRSIVTFDMEGKSISRLSLASPTLSFTLSFEVSSLFPVNFGDSKSLIVTPDGVDGDTIHVKTTKGTYHIVWRPVNNTNYGDLVYEVNFLTHKTIVSSPEISLNTVGTFKPYQAINVSITARTPWASSGPTRSLIYTPESIPSKPRLLRVYWKGVSPGMNEYTVRWLEPEDENGKLLHHIIRCIDTNSQQEICPNATVQYPDTEIALVLVNTDIQFSVIAATSQGLGSESNFFVTKSTEIYPIPRAVYGLVKPPRVMLSDVDSGESKMINVPVDPHFIVYNAKGNSLIIVNNNGEVYELDLERETATYIRRLESNIDYVMFDGIGRYLYYVHGRDIKRIDFENQRTEAQDIFSSSDRITTLEISSDGQFFYTDVKNRMFTFKLSSGGHMSDIKGLGQSLPSDRNCNCRSIEKISTFSTIKHNKQFSLSLRNKKTGDVFIADTELCKCTKIASTQLNEKVNIKADMTNVYVLQGMQANMTVFSLWNKDVSLVDSKNMLNFDIISMNVMCIQCDQIETDCVKISSTKQNVEYVAIRETYSMVKLPFPMISGSCNKSIQLPSTNYTVSYHLSTSDLDDESEIKSLSYYNTGNLENRTLKIDNLVPNSRYTLCVRMFNVYSQSKDEHETDLNRFCSEFTTEEGHSGPPEHIVAHVLSPSEVRVSWEAPTKVYSSKLNYEIYWKSTEFINGVYSSGNVVSLHEGNKTRIISNLPPNQTFEMWMTSLSPKGKVSAKSQILKVQTFSTPKLVKVLSIEPRRINFSWVNTEEAVETHQFIYYSVTENATQHYLPETPMTSEYLRAYWFSIPNLSPSHCYMIKVLVTYKSNPGHQLVWPVQEESCVMTEKDKPLVPGVPYLDSKENNHITLTWKRNEEKVLQYELQKMTLYEEDKWITIYNGTVNQFIASGLANGNYTFRVRAFNSNGFSNFSIPSMPIDLEMVRQLQLISNTNDKVTIGAICAGAIGLTIVVCVLYFLVTQNRFAMKKKCLLSSHHPADTELANLRELPIRGGFINCNNPMYNQLEVVSDEDLAMIPKIKRSQITLTKFLGSGAFGEVFEGGVKELDSEDGVETRIAVKTLRKGATDNEKLEFLKEAKLMWNFKHDHILNLNAICLDNDPNFLILELMEAGDLQSYLRAHRPKGPNQGLNLLDLVEMCLDVAKGCEYLEQLHFVHRDLAARNCLVSSYDPAKRRVKIGDFGLARDIYKNDYYRKEGEGLLPVRWMAPESLMDGVFTTQSDVWSFGILLWEILSMGANPYPTLSNREVMLYVRAGNRLEQPPNSPERLHELMTSCWCYLPSDRPSFKMCVQEIECLIEQDSSLSSLSNSFVSYIRNTGSGSECSHPHFHSATTVPVSQISRGLNSSGSGGRTPPYSDVNLKSSAPKYLQLVHEDYELPRDQGNQCSCTNPTSRFNGYGNLRTVHTKECTKISSKFHSQIPNSLPSTSSSSIPLPSPFTPSASTTSSHSTPAIHTNLHTNLTYFQTNLPDISNPRAPYPIPKKRTRIPDRLSSLPASASTPNINFPSQVEENQIYSDQSIGSHNHLTYQTSSHCIQDDDQADFSITDDTAVIIGNDCCDEENTRETESIGSIHKSIKNSEKLNNICYEVPTLNIT